MNNANFLCDMTLTEKINRTAKLNAIILERLNAVKSELTAEYEEFEALTASIKNEVCEGLQSVKGDGLAVIFVKGGESVTWDDSALQGLAVTMPDILKFRSAKPTKPTVRFVYAK